MYCTCLHAPKYQTQYILFAQCGGCNYQQEGKDSEKQSDLFTWLLEITIICSH